MINVLLVDDHPIIRRAISDILAKVEGFEVIAEAKNGEEAMDFISKQPVHMVFMDISMPGMGGLEATRRLLEINPQLKIIVLSAFIDDTYLHHFSRIGVLGYLSKNASQDEIIHAIQAVHSGQMYVEPKIESQFSLKRLQKKDVSPFLELSSREMEVMLMLVEGCRVGKIAEKLVISPKTVSTYRQRLLEKLDVKTNTDVLQLAIQWGVIQVSNPVKISENH